MLLRSRTVTRRRRRGPGRPPRVARIVRRLQAENARLEALVAEHEARLDDLEDRITGLEYRLAAVRPFDPLRQRFSAS